MPYTARSIISMYYGEFNADTKVVDGTITPSTGAKAGADIKSFGSLQFVKQSLYENNDSYDDGDYSDEDGDGYDDEYDDSGDDTDDTGLKDTAYFICSFDLNDKNPHWSFKNIDAFPEMFLHTYYQTISCCYNGRI